MNTSNLPIVIVGSGMAAYFLAIAIREQDKQVPVVMLCEKDGRFYPKPMLSSAFYHDKSLEDIVTASAETMMSKHDLRIITQARVVSVDPTSQTVTYQQDSDTLSLAYKSVVLATGSRHRTLALQGAEHIYQVNDLEAYERLHSALQDAKTVALIGTGLVGVEFAHDLLHKGYKVTLLSRDSSALHGLVSKAVGDRVRDHLISMGAEWIELQDIHACHMHEGKYVVNVDKRNVSADVVMASIGLEANTAINIAGIEKDNRGFITDAYARTNHEHVYAIGDCAYIAGLHLTYVAPIKQQVKALSQTLTSTPVSIHYPPMPVVVKTPTLPLTLVPVRGNFSGAWQDIEHTDKKMVSAFYDSDGVLRGFALMQDATVDRAKWLEKMPDLL